MGLDLARPWSPEWRVLYVSGVSPRLATRNLNSEDGSPLGSASGFEGGPSSLCLGFSVFKMGTELTDSSI